MLTKALAPALPTRELLSAMLTNAAAPTILATIPPSAVLTNAAAPAILAMIPPSAVLTNDSTHILFGRHLKLKLFCDELHRSCADCFAAAAFRLPLFQ
jgi:hypothetical protein